ncbi:secreted and spore coat-associated protein [Geomicrobium sp. JCM 19037]|uniref:CalY family protein n=1 Tax=unclassified Geomicrobium TaxID=2628951 RepID=UPI00045F3B5A|nr:CalY family protein [Geomicrobium sp. JCM 19037]GAK02884.1 secreted and spore coat-associated protein [Geomicrobium sp. JCM 19037]
MTVKKQLGMGVATAALGLTLIGGGTYAFFSDSVTTNNTFAAGTLDLTAEPTEVINVDNIKPGDSMIRDFELGNDGSLDIGLVTLETDYRVIDAQGNNTDDFGNFIEVEFLYNVDNLDEVIYQTTLSELQDMSPEAISENIFYPELGDQGLPVGETHDLVVQFNFLSDVEEDLNQFQGDSLQLEWTFVATQTTGDDNR